MAALTALMLYVATSVQAQQSAMTFFITSVGSGKGGDLGGLAGADRHCQMLAQAVGAGHRTWHAYLSTSASSDQPAVNARDRIGSGPWRNTTGVVIARDIRARRRLSRPMLDAISKPGECVVQLGLDVRFEAPKMPPNATVGPASALAWWRRLSGLRLKLCR
jgi:hypothetical protein